MESQPAVVKDAIQVAITHARVGVEMVVDPHVAANA